MADINISYRIEKARILEGDGRKTFGDFRAWLCAAMSHALRGGRKDISFRQRNVAAEFGVSRDTIVSWCRRAYAEGLLKAKVQRIQLADGTWRRIANRYVVALSVRLRGILRDQWAKLMGSCVSERTKVSLKRCEAQEPQKTEVSPYVGFSRHQHSTPVKNDHLPVARDATGDENSSARRSWTCRVCCKPNARAALRCYGCRAERPFMAETGSKAP